MLKTGTGVDSLPHRVVLEAGADTIAVLGCGLGHTYHPENWKLCNEIFHQGAILSEFPVLIASRAEQFSCTQPDIELIIFGNRGGGDGSSKKWCADHG